MITATKPTTTGRKDQGSHDQMVQVVVNYLRTDGHSHTIMADLPGHAQPGKIAHPTTGENFIPDILTVRGTTVAPHLDLIVEIETSDTLFNKHSHAQWQAFSSLAKQVGGLFYLVAPKGYMKIAELALKKAGVTNATTIEV